MKKSDTFIWMPLIGFDRNQPDKGVGEYIEKAGFIPKGVSVFLFHPDAINQHGGMDKEITLPPDCCSYYGSPRNEFRERQEWTNYDLKALAGSLKEFGIEAYLGVDGVYLNDIWHNEWESEHKELMSFGCNGRMNLNVLKRFKDGSYYEDFFVKKVCEALDDYGFSGLHVSDFFCPPEHSICNGDFSTDLLLQFKEYSNVSFPENISTRLGFDEQDDIDVRKKYIWENLRREWIEFYAWRWESFWKKISSALHKKRKKVMINNAWCSDPFEAIYRYGIDYKRLYRAGVDYFVAETLPNGIELLDNTGDMFRQYMSMAQLMSAYSPEGELLTLLGVKDCTEEWDMLHHQPIRLEKDMYTLASLYTNNGGLERSTSGFMVTLGDGITEDEWTWIREREEIAFAGEAKRLLAPTVIWSDNAHYSMLDEYIKTRRPSLHKIMYELQNRNATLGAVARIENIGALNGAIVVPNFDLLSKDERRAVLSYKNGAVICIAPAGYVKENNIEYDSYFEDEFASFKLSVFVLNSKAKTRYTYEACKKTDFKSSEDVKNWVDESFFLKPMPFASMSDGFLSTVAEIIEAEGMDIFSSEAQLLPFELENGIYRIYVFNTENIYKRMKINTKRGIKSVKAVSKYPLMPVKYVLPVSENDEKLDGAKAESMRIGKKFEGVPYGFEGKVPPLGVSIFDVELSDN